jgi:hypothetical protein
MEAYQDSWCISQLGLSVAKGKDLKYMQQKQDRASMTYNVDFITATKTIGTVYSPYGMIHIFMNFWIL